MSSVKGHDWATGDQTLVNSCRNGFVMLRFDRNLCLSQLSSAPLKIEIRIFPPFLILGESVQWRQKTITMLKKENFSKQKSKKDWTDI